MMAYAPSWYFCGDGFLVEPSDDEAGSNPFVIVTKPCERDRVDPGQ